MGRQWLQKKRDLNAAKRAKSTSKLVREITVAAKSGVADPEMNPRLHAAVEAARKQSVSNDVISRAIKKGSGQLGEGVQLETLVYEGFAPHKVPVIVECVTDNKSRTVPEIRVLFRSGQLGAHVRFHFDHLGVVEATHEGAGLDIEAAAIEAGAENVEPLEHVADGQTGARFLTHPQDLDAVTKALRAAGWSVTLSEMGYIPKDKMELPPEQRADVEAFLEALDDHDDVHRIYAALA